MCTKDWCLHKVPEIQYFQSTVPSESACIFYIPCELKIVSVFYALLFVELYLQT